MKAETLTNHLRVARYGKFVLTEAIRPAQHVPIVPREGYRIDTYRDRRLRLAVPVLAAAVSSERLFDAFLALLEPLGPVVDVVLETSHHSKGPEHRDLVREQIDLPVLSSYLCEFEELLLNDGCAGVAVISASGPMEVQFDEHKLLVVYARDMEPFERILQEFGVQRDDSLKLITEGEHMHSSDERFADEFTQLCTRVGVEDAVERVNW